MTMFSYDVPPGIAFVPVDKYTGEIVTPTPENQKFIVWEALRKDRLPPLHPERGIWENVPEWLRGIGSFFRLGD